MGGDNRVGHSRARATLQLKISLFAQVTVTLLGRVRTLESRKSNSFLIFYYYNCNLNFPDPEDF